ncbi:ectoine/hydroxyectoine ABC transporter substrate-binding protein EhuB [Actinopolymorpha sp. B11F2]|uniref:ectoine/hydroxyectoine ABC transporter substrate-binding protein EhuB n=1 Tax=Actinopolymorpha sp. B11F2 TaxID=3160862 RepID=UPI0032E4379B
MVQKPLPNKPLPRLGRRGFLRHALFAGAASVAVAGCGRSLAGTNAGAGDTLARIKREGAIKVAFANEAPYGFKNTGGDLVGEAPAVAREVFTRMGVPTLEGKLVEFGSLIPALQAGAVDVIAAGMYITPERCGQIAFSEPDYCGKSAFLVRKGNPDGIKTYDDVAKAGIRLGVVGGAIEVTYAEGAGVKNLVSFTDSASGFEGLTANRIDAFSLTSITLRFLLDNRDGLDLEVTEPFVPVVDGKPQTGCGGYGFRPADADLLEEFNSHLGDVKDSGDLLEIIEPYGFSKAELPTDQTTKSLCSG